MHAKLSTQLEMQGDPNTENEATSLYNLLCSNFFPCKVQLGSQSKFLFSLPRKTTTLCFHFTSPWLEIPPGTNFTQIWNSPHMFLFIQRSYVWAVCHPMPESKFFMN